MNTTTFNTTIATEVEDAVMNVYNCKRHDIVQFIDSDVKKVVVFILFHHFNYSRKLIGWHYQMTYLYVPTVAEEYLFWYGKNKAVRDKIDLVLSKVQSYKMAV